MSSMKQFDVVIGNPPYQDSNKKSKNSGLWVSFTNLAFELSCDTVCLVTPPWFNNKKIKDTISKYSLLFVNKSISHYFKGVGTKVCSYAVKKCKPNDHTENKISILESSLADSIGNKVFKSKSVMGFSTKQRANSYDKGLKLFKAYHTKTDLVEVVNNAKNSNKKKIVISKSGYMKPVFDNGEYGTTENSFWAEVNSKSEGINALTYMNSKLVDFIVHYAFKYSGFNSDNIVHDLPKLDFSKSWTNEQLYSHFNLTQDEIDWIEKHYNNNP